MPTKIEWADEVWNPITGCSKISEGCDNCYAERMAKRLAGRCGYYADAPFRVTWHPTRLGDPMCWKKQRRVFVCSMGDLFHEDVKKEWIDAVFRTMMTYSKHVYMVLTKRPERMEKYLNDEIPCRPESNGLFKSKVPWNSELHSHIWFGVTAENQQRAEERIPILLRIPAAVRFVSIEPMLGPVDLTRLMFPHGGFENVLNCSVGPVARRNGIDKLEGIDWVICGGETGQKARPLHPDWVRDVKDNCKVHKVPFFFKQWGEFLPVCQYSDKLHVWGISLVSSPQTDAAPIAKRVRVGKKAAGRLLDGVEHSEFPSSTVHHSSFIIQNS